MDDQTADLTGTIPPQVIEAEMALLGSVIVGAGSDVCGRLEQDNFQGEYFYRQDHQAIFDAMRHIHARKEGRGCIDLVLLRDELNLMGKLREVGGVEYLMRLTESVPTCVNALYYSRIVRDAALKRRGIQTAEDAKNKFFDPTCDLRETLQSLYQGAEKLIRTSEANKAPEPYGYQQLVKDILSSNEGLKTGYNSLDDYLRISPGALTIICGRPGHGKTSLMLNMLVNQLDDESLKDKQFYFYGYEEPGRFTATKIIMLLAGVTLSQKHNQAEYTKILIAPEDERDITIENAINKFKDYTESGRLVICDQRYDADDLAASIGSLDHKETGCVYIDYIQKIPSSVNVMTLTRQQQVAYTSALLLNRAIRNDLPIIFGAQLNRQGDDTIKLEHLRECGDLEQDANLVIGLFNESAHTREDDGDGDDTKTKLQLKILKNRDGFAGHKINMTFDGPIRQIRE